MSELHVYITEDCWSCAEAKRIVAEIRPLFPSMEIEVRDVNDQRRPSQVFATPTYILNGRTIYLGNPTQDELAQKLRAE
jgi:hypothetical protein